MSSSFNIVHIIVLFLSVSTVVSASAGVPAVGVADSGSAIAHDQKLPALFVNPVHNRAKIGTFSNLYVQTTHMSDLRSSTFEERLSVVIKESPLLSLQSLLSLFIVLNVIAESLSIVPLQFQSRLRAQCCVTIACIKLMDAFRSIDLADYAERDSYVDEELCAAAAQEISHLVRGFSSQSVAYYLICILCKSPKGCVIPFLISEFPSLVRYSLILWLCAGSAGDTEHDATIKSFFIQSSSQANNSSINTGSSNKVPRKKSQIRRVRQGRQGRQNDGESDRETDAVDGAAVSDGGLRIGSIHLPAGVAGFDQVCEIVSFGLEVVILGFTLVKLGKFKSSTGMNMNVNATPAGTHQIRGFRDLALLAIQVLVILNYLSLRIDLFLASMNGRQILNRLIQIPVFEEIMKHPVVSEAATTIELFSHVLRRIRSGNSLGDSLREAFLTKTVDDTGSAATAGESNNQQQDSEVEEEEKALFTPDGKVPIVNGRRKKSSSSSSISRKTGDRGSSNSKVTTASSDNERKPEKRKQKTQTNNKNKGKNVAGSTESKPTVGTNRKNSKNNKSNKTSSATIGERKTKKQKKK